MEIYIRKNGESTGPYSPEQIHEALARNEITLSDEAWRVGLTVWMPLNMVLSLSEGGKAVTPLKAASATTTPVPYLSPQAQSASRQPLVGGNSFEWLRKAGGCTGGCCFLPVLIAAMVLIGLIGVWLAGDDKSTASISNGVASVEVDQEGYVNGNLYDQGLYLGLAVSRVAGTVWETAHDHPDVHAVIVHLNMKYPREVSRDRFGNETKYGGEWAHLCDIEINDLATVRRYRDAEAYAVFDHDVVYFYQQKIEPSFRQYRANILHGTE